MANQEYLDIIKQGVETWNQWRKEHPDIMADLIKADLRDTNLTGANLTDTILNDANLTGANLTDTILTGALLIDAIFTGANLTGANLTDTHFVDTILTNVDFTDARMGGTSFGNVDLSTAKGLETVKNSEPSTIGIDTILRSQGKIPEIFLRELDVQPSIIEAIPSLVGSLKPIDFYSCFISYSSKDREFAERLYADLQSKGVRCWYAPEDMKTGDEIRSRIDEAIRIHDKLLLVLSEHSVGSTWVKKEVETAFEKEQQQKRLVLFPVRLDDTVMQTTKAWAADIRRMRHITDFTWWKDHDKYQKAFTRLLRDLKAEAEKTEKTEER